MSKMDAPSMQDVYILSPVSGLYSTRSDACTHRCLMMDPADDTDDGADDSDDDNSAFPLGRSWA